MTHRKSKAIHQPHAKQHQANAIMGYPDSFEGFMIEDQKKWTEFKKHEVSPSFSLPWGVFARIADNAAVQAKNFRGQ